MEGNKTMHPTPTRFPARTLYPQRGWRALLWAGVLTLFFLLTWQVATSFAAPLAAPSPLEGEWRFVDESKPGAPAVSGTWTATTGDAPADVVAHFALSSTMQAVALQLYNPALAGQSFSQLSELSYCTRLINSPLPYAVMLQLNLDADVTDNDRSWQGRLVYTPADNGAVVQGGWQCWDTLNGKWWASGGPVAAHAAAGNAQPLATLLAQFPNLGVHSDYGAVVLKVGAGWSYFQGEASPVVVSLGSDPMTLTFAPELEIEPNEVLLPVAYQDDESDQPSNNGNNNDDKKDKKPKDQEPEKEKKSKHNGQQSFNWGRVGWENFNWDDVDWDHVDWSTLEWDNLEWRGDSNERAKAIKAFVADVEQCKDKGWEETGFNNQGECVAYYVQEHTPSSFDWGRNRGDDNNDSKDDDYNHERKNDDRDSNDDDDDD
jgi:hypothetical protein